MRNNSLIMVGAVFFVVGLLLRSDLVEPLWNVLAWLAMIIGVTMFASGVFLTAQGKR